MDNKDKRFALLIDGDNISSKYLQTIIDEITNEGIVTYKRIYGDWTQPNLGPWKPVLLNYSITPMQQYAYTAGKNSTDSAMIIDAMDILYSGRVDGFCLVSSDSDFTRLATRLREAGMFVIGMGKKQTPRPFIAACSRFVYLDLISEESPETSEKEPAAPAGKKKTPKGPKEPESKPTPAPQPDAAAENSSISEKEIKAYINRLLDDTPLEDDTILLSLLGNLLEKKYPDFDPRNYGKKKLIDLVKAWGFNVHHMEDKNNTANPTGKIYYVSKPKK